MAKIYRDLVLSGDRTLEQVPHLWRTDVEKMLNDNKVDTE